MYQLEMVSECAKYSQIFDNINELFKRAQFLRENGFRVTYIYTLKKYDE